MGIGIEKAIENKDAITIMFVCVFLLLTFLKLGYPILFVRMFTSVFSKTFFQDFSNELTGSFTMFKIFLFLMQNIILALFFYAVLISNWNLSFSANHYVIFVVFIAISAYMFLHYFVSYVVSIVFNFDEIFKKSYIVRSVYLKIVTLLMLPVLLFLFFGGADVKYFVHISFCILSVLMLLRALIILADNNKVIYKNLFYFILYLCALEIAPLLMVYKVVVNKYYIL